MPTDLAPAAPKKRLALIAAILGSFVAGLDATVVNTALPAIARDLGGGLAGQQWVTGAYLLTLGSLILVGGSIGDVFGERRAFTIGVIGFGVASVGCALAPTIELLVAARALQGVFGALLTPAALAVIVAVFPRAERGAAIGSWTAWQAISGVIGPFVGGWLIDAASWRLIFAINVPFVIATVVLVGLAVPAPQPGRGPRRRVDLSGAVLCALGLAGPVFALIRQPAVGWGSAEVVVGLLAGAALFAGFIVREAVARDPMLPLRLFRRRNFAWGNLETLVLYGGLSIVLFLLTLYLQQAVGWNALEAGLATLPATVVMFLLSRRVGALATRFGPRAFMGGGPLLAAAGVLWIAMLPQDVDYLTDLLPGLLVFAAGLTLTVAPLSAAVLADADEHNAGIASATNNAVARVAGLVAIAGVGAVVASGYARSVDRALGDRPLGAPAREVVARTERAAFASARTDGLPRAEGRRIEAAIARASATAYRDGMLLAAGLVAFGGLLGLVGIRNAARTADGPPSAEDREAVAAGGAG